jgi:sigma-54 specific flagellar transcriptional regulator A
MDSGINMNKLSRYSLVGDNCENCNYLANAFTLLRLPLDRFSLTNLIECDDHLPGVATVFLCKHIEAENGKRVMQKINTSKAHLISFSQAKPDKSGNTPVHYLKMPFSLFDLNRVLVECIHDPDDDLTDTAIDHPVFERLIGQSVQIRKIRSMIKQVAYSDSTVLILGQSGTGKDVIASCIHYFSNRKNNSLVPINCGAIPSELMESELFGHEKGAFTGALTRRAGRFEIANGGTLFLDEIGDMPLPMQVKLLRVIQERKIDRVGGSASIKVDVRLIAATNKNLEELIQQGRFREDLFYRLNVFPINVPSLSERKDDIPALIDYHLEKIHERLKHKVIFTDRAKDILCNYAWPGNIRELENFLERMVILHRDQVVDEKDIDSAYKQQKLSGSLPALMTSHEAPFNFKEYIANTERQMIQFALDRSNGIINAAADYLSLGRSALLEKMKKYNLISSG